MTVSPAGFDAVVLAGGAGRRMGGVDKPGLVVGSATLLDRVLTAIPDARSVVAVGPSRPTCLPVRWVRESPPGGGPLAALGAALPHVESGVVALLAADLPFLDRATIARLRRARGERDGAVVIDDTGRDQLLVSVWRTEVLRAAMPAEPSGGSLRGVLSCLDVVRERVPVGVDACPPWRDCDTPEQLLQARRSA